MEDPVPCCGTRRVRKQFEALRINYFVGYHQFLKDTLSIDRFFLEFCFFLRLLDFVFPSVYLLSVYECISCYTLLTIERLSD